MDKSDSPLDKQSPFAPIEEGRVVFETDGVIAFYDRYPVSLGHTLVVAKQCTPSLFDLSEDMQTRVWRAVAVVRDRLRAAHQPDGFNIGLNDGAAAGQTVAHAHIHIIPRYTGDQPDPRGGIRWIVPDKARYWDE